MEQVSPPPRENRLLGSVQMNAIYSNNTGGEGSDGEKAHRHRGYEAFEDDNDSQPLLSSDDTNSEDHSINKTNHYNEQDKTTSVFSAKTVKLLLLGQLISAIECATGVFNTLLQRRGVDIPCSQNVGMYLLLAIVYVPILVRQGDFKTSLIQNGHKFFGLALIDVQANFAIVTAYQYTNFTSVQLIDCSNLGFVVLLSRYILKTRYTKWHLFGVLICLLGNGGVIISDWLSAKHDEDSVGMNPPLGDGLVMLAAFLYACSNVGEEYYVRALDSSHFLGFIGLFGTLIASVQAYILEKDQWLSMQWTHEVIALLVGYTLILFSMYSLVPVLIKRGGAVLFNLSLLTADVYSFIIGYLAFKIHFTWLYFPAFGVVLIGILLYTRAPEHRKEIHLS